MQSYPPHICRLQPLFETPAVAVGTPCRPMSQLTSIPIPKTYRYIKALPEFQPPTFSKNPPNPVRPSSKTNQSRAITSKKSNFSKKPTQNPTRRVLPPAGYNCKCRERDLARGDAITSLSRSLSLVGCGVCTRGLATAFGVFERRRQLRLIIQARRGDSSAPRVLRASWPPSPAAPPLAVYTIAQDSVLLLLLL